MTGDLVPFNRTPDTAVERRPRPIVTTDPKQPRRAIVRAPMRPATPGPRGSQFDEVRFFEPAEGSVIKFKLRHSGNHTVYSYAAMRVNGRWYTTGHTCPWEGYSWEGLCRWVDTRELIGVPTLWDGR